MVRGQIFSDLSLLQNLFKDYKTEKRISKLAKKYNCDRTSLFYQLKKAGLFERGKVTTGHPGGSREKRTVSTADFSKPPKIKPPTEEQLRCWSRIEQSEGQRITGKDYKDYLKDYKKKGGRVVKMSEWDEKTTLKKMTDWLRKRDPYCSKCRFNMHSCRHIGVQKESI